MYYPQYFELPLPFTHHQSWLEWRSKNAHSTSTKYYILNNMFLILLALSLTPLDHSPACFLSSGQRSGAGHRQSDNPLPFCKLPASRCLVDTLLLRGTPALQQIIFIHLLWFRSLTLLLSELLLPLHKC